MSWPLILAIGGLVGAAFVLFDPGTAGRLSRLTSALSGSGALSGSSALSASDTLPDGRARGGEQQPNPGTVRARSRRGGGESAADHLAFDLELVAICLQSGLTTERALILAAQAGGDRSGLGRVGHAIALGQNGPDRKSVAAAEVDEQLRPVVALIDFSRHTGVALAPLLRGLSSDLRRSEHRRRQLAAARLGVTLVVPLGVCILPAFILLGIVPVVITLISDMAGVFQ